MKPSLHNLLNTVTPTVDRRSFFKTLGLGAGATMALTGTAAADAAANVVQSNVKRASEPSALKITDLRVAVVAGAPMTCPVIRVDTNQGLVGWGEVRDGASETYALFLKSRVLGENPCNVDKVFRKIKQFGAPARQAGGVCGVEMACMDRGITYLKQDFGIDLLKDKPGMLSMPSGDPVPWGGSRVMHPFTGVE